MKIILPYLFALILLASAVGHIVKPEFYGQMIPSFLPETLVNILAAIAEVVVGLALIIPRFRNLGGLSFMLLMLAFLPVHIWDLTREEPAVGSHTAAAIRLLIQGLLIYAGYWIWKRKP